MPDVLLSMRDARACQELGSRDPFVIPGMNDLDIQAF